VVVVSWTQRVPFAIGSAYGAVDEFGEILGVHTLRALFAEPTSEGRQIEKQFAAYSDYRDALANAKLTTRQRSQRKTEILGGLLRAEQAMGWQLN
jgi:hypothetical protein